MANGIRTCKYGAGLSVLSMTIAEKEGIICRIAFSQNGTLTDKTPSDIDTTFHPGARGYDEIRTVHAVANVHGIVHVPVNATVHERGSPFHSSKIPYKKIFYGSRIADSYVVTDRTSVGGNLFRV